VTGAGFGSILGLPALSEVEGSLSRGAWSKDFVFVKVSWG
jgi:hypothetical protein